MADNEQRQSGRANRRLMLRYREVGSASWLVSPLQDVSRTGARFLSEQAFTPGAAVQCQLMLPMLKEPLALSGRIVRTRTSTMGLTEIGLAFDPPAPEAEAMLKQAIEFFLKR